MAQYKLIEIATGNIENIISWDGISEYEVPSGYELLELTSSISWDGNYGEASGSFSTPYSGDFVGNFYGSASYALTASYALNGGGTVDLDNVDHITFDTTSTTPVTEGTFVWNDGDGTLDLGLKGGNVTLQVGQQEYAMAYNSDSVLLTKGTVVYISGSQGNRIAVKKASAVAEEGSRNTLGVVAESISVGNEGLILLSGVLHGLNTTASNAGATLFLDTVPGQYTETRPLAPNHTVIVGFAQRIHESQGSIFVKIDNGYEIDELHNISITDVSNGDLLVRDGEVWVNKKVLSGSYRLSGSLDVSGSVTASFAGWFTGSFSGSYTGSLYGTSSNATTASYVQSIKSGVAFSGSVQQNIAGEYIYNISFATNYTNQNYAVTITAAEDARIWTVENKTFSGFRINSNSNDPTVGDVYWIAVPYNS